MMDIGKIRAITEGVEGANKKDPWINVPYSELQLQETLDVYNQLVNGSLQLQETLDVYNQLVDVQCPKW